MSSTRSSSSSSTATSTSISSSQGSSERRPSLTSWIVGSGGPGHRSSSSFRALQATGAVRTQKATIEHDDEDEESDQAVEDIDVSVSAEPELFS